MQYDAAIIGTGPAGLSAALTLKARGKSFVWIGNPQLSDKVRRAERIENYPGLSPVTGEELSEAFRRQCEAMKLPILDRMVTAVMPFGDHYALVAGEDFHEARTVLFATGVAAVGTLPGEGELVGRGVSYCATCDGNLYRGAAVGVLCSSRRFEHEAAYLAGLAGQVYYFPQYREPSFTGDNVTYVNEPIVKLETENGRLSGVVLRSGERLPIRGLFCLRDAVALETLLPGLATEDGHIRVDRRMATNLPGCFAAGDCTGRPYQYVKAAGEGNVAAHSMLDYLAASEKQAR